MPKPRNGDYEKEKTMKNIIFGAFGAIGGAVAWLFGGWTMALTTLLIFMAIDYITGIIVAGVFHKSGKSKTGSLSSIAGIKGLAKKGMILLFVLIAYRLDLQIGTTYIKDAVCIAFMANELLSIVENAGLMGVPIPEVIVKAIEVLKHRKDALSKREDENE